MFRSSEGSNSNDTNVTSKQEETQKEVIHDDIDPKDPKANEAAKIIQHAYRKHQEHQEHHDSCHKHQY